jgi:hypothetical protein
VGAPPERGVRVTTTSLSCTEERGDAAAALGTETRYLLFPPRSAVVMCTESASPCSSNDAVSPLNPPATTWVPPGEPELAVVVDVLEECELLRVVELDDERVPAESSSSPLQATSVVVTNSTSTPQTISFMPTA